MDNKTVWQALTFKELILLDNRTVLMTCGNIKNIITRIKYILWFKTHKKEYMNTHNWTIKATSSARKKWDKNCLNEDANFQLFHYSQGVAAQRVALHI